MKPIIVFSIIILAACASSQTDVPQDMLLADQGYSELIKGNYERAEAIFTVALSINPENPYALLNLGVLYQNTGQLEKAREMYQRLIDTKTEAVAVQSTSSKYKKKKLVEIAKENLAAIGSGSGPNRMK